MTFGWPQITYVALTFVGVGIHLARDGEPHRYDAKWVLIGAALSLTLLYCGGFFGARP